MATASDTPAHDQAQLAANAVLVDELKSLLKLREAEEASAVAAHADVMRKLYEQDRQQIELAIKAVELGEMLGADATDARPDQLPLRDIRDGRRRLVLIPSDRQGRT